MFANIFCYICNIFCYFCHVLCLLTFFVTFVTFFELVSTPRTTTTRTTTRTTKLLLGPLSVARGQKKLFRLFPPKSGQKVARKSRRSIFLSKNHYSCHFPEFLRGSIRWRQGSGYLYTKTLWLPFPAPFVLGVRRREIEKPCYKLLYIPNTLVLKKERSVSKFFVIQYRSK